MSTTTGNDLRYWLGQCRGILERVAWSPSWEDAEPEAEAARRVLEFTTVICFPEDMPEYMPDDLSGVPPHVGEVWLLWRGAVEALDVVGRLIATANLFVAAGEDPTLVCRRLVSEALATLNVALDQGWSCPGDRL